MSEQNRTNGSAEGTDVSESVPSRDTNGARAFTSDVQNAIRDNLRAGCIHSEMCLKPEDDLEAFFEMQQKLDSEKRSQSVSLDLRGYGMEMVERQICFYFQYLDAHVDAIGEGAYQPQTIIVITTHEAQEPWSKIHGLQWIQVSD